jgi:hypothetical protein
MSDETSARLSLPFLSAGQAQKEVMHNEALQALDMLVQPVASSADVSTPPTSPSIGACWIVAAFPDGEWTGHAGDIAQWTPGGWRFAAPEAGWRCHVLDRDGTMHHDGSAWRDGAVREDGIYVTGVRVVGARQGSIAPPTGGTVVDSEARAGIGAILAALQAHGLLSS